jgi:hypothetical protein
MAKIVFAFGFALALAGCPHGPYESVFEDGGFRLAPRTFNTGNSGTDECPGELLGSASQGSASCSSAPQRCRITPAPGGRALECQCNASDAGAAGVWSCR